MSTERIFPHALLGSDQGDPRDGSIVAPYVTMMVILVGIFATILLFPIGSVECLGFINGLLCLGFIAVAGLVGPVDRTSPAVWMNLGLLVMFSAHPLAMFYTGTINDRYHGAYDVRPGYELALLLALFGILGFNTGYILFKLLRRSNPYERIGIRPMLSTQDATASKSRAALRASNLCACGALVLYGLYAITIGQNPLDAIVAGAGTQDAGSTTAYLYFGPQLLGPATALRTYAVVSNGRGKFGLAALIIVQLLLFIPTGQRLVLLLTLVPSAIAFYVLTKRRMSTALLVVLSLVSLTLIIGLRDVSGANDTFFENLGNSLESPTVAIQTFLTGADTEMVDGLSVEVQTVPTSIPFEPGSTLVGALAAPIPSVLWPAKPVTMDSVINGYLLGIERNNSGVAYSFIGELYFDSAIPGVLFGMALVGLLSALIKERLLNANESAWVLVYAAIVPSIVSLARGVLAYSLGRSLFTVVPLVIFALYLQRAYGSDRSNGGSRLSHREPSIEAK